MKRHVDVLKAVRTTRLTVVDVRVALEELELRVKALEELLKKGDANEIPQEIPR